MNRAQRRAKQRDDRLTSAPDNQRPPTVVIAIVNPGEVSMACMASVLRLRDYMVKTFGMLPGFLERRARSQHVWRARNELVARFLTTDCDLLWFVDADMGVQEDALVKLVAVVHSEERPIVAGLCFAQRQIKELEDTYATEFDIIPTVQLWKEEGGQIVAFNVVVDYPRDTVCQIDATGAACVMIHRSVLERMRERFGDHWFTPIANPKTQGQFGEDTSFFLRCRTLGIPVHMHTGVKTSHDKGGIFLTEEAWDAQQARVEAPR